MRKSTCGNHGAWKASVAALALGVTWPVAARAQELAADLAGARWLWAEPGAAAGAPAGRHGFRTRFTLPGEAAPATALVTITVDNFFELYLNGALACGNTTAKAPLR